MSFRQFTCIIENTRCNPDLVPVATPAANNARPDYVVATSCISRKLAYRHYDANEKKCLMRSLVISVLVS